MASVRITRAQWRALGAMIEWESDPSTGEYLPVRASLIPTGTMVALLDRKLLGFVRNGDGGVIGHETTAAGRRAYAEYANVFVEEVRTR